MIASTVHPALSGHAPLASIVGARIYRDYAGDAPNAPYVVWSILATVPSQSVSRLAGYADRYSVEFLSAIDWMPSPWGCYFRRLCGNTTICWPCPW